MGAMAQRDAVPVNGSDRILISGAPLRRVMPNGWLGNPANISLPILTGASPWMAPGTRHMSSVIMKCPYADRGWIGLRSRGTIKL